ncbi:uncharacterized protein LOC112885437 [Panicum hallii]|uniref:uncharacterized protein LOC112885437 n=1 Tax=Panicum hallii TaxID=206008 RepID=UPI000DF4D7DD|nr:uncharacterized protein LOC112885437 [Panicum hallii]
MRMLAYGSPADSFDDTYRMAESTVLETVKQFARTVIAVYESDFLRPPTASELETILRVNEARGFPGMIGSIDCMHWEWSNCPTAWHGQYKGHKGKPTIILEAVATQDLRIWHAYFGLPGSHNDINVLHRSPVFYDLVEGRRPQFEFDVNGNKYNMCYYLADGIYPDWATLPEFSKIRGLFPLSKISDVKIFGAILSASLEATAIEQPAENLTMNLVITMEFQYKKRAAAGSSERWEA